MTLEQIVELLKQVTEEVQKIKNSSEHKVEQDEDAQIIALAGKYPFKGHILVDKSDTIKKYYIATLLSLFSAETDMGLSRKQRLYICRILASYDSKIQIKEYVSQSLRVDLKYLMNLVEVLDAEVSFYFAVDLITLNMLGGNECGKKECERISDVLQMLGLGRTAIVKAARISKALIEQRFIQFLQQIEAADKINYSYFLGYFPENKYTSITNSLTDIQKLKGNVVIANAHIANYREYIELDKCVAEKIDFYHCSFSNIRGIRSNKKPVIFDECTFEKNCFGSEKDYVFIQGHKMVFKNTVFNGICVSKHILNIAESEIENCKFIDCKGIELPCSYMFQIDHGKVTGSLFKNCTMKIHEEEFITVPGGILLISNGILQKNHFQNCIAEGNRHRSFRYPTYKMQIVIGITSRIEKCCFEKCKCLFDNGWYPTVTCYILGVKNSTEYNNEFVDCFSYHYRCGEKAENYIVGQIV